MASSRSFNSNAFVFVGLVLAACISCAFGDIVCEQLDQSTCAFAVSATGMRCVLEKHVKRGGSEKYVCHTSGVEAEGIKDRIETDECITACGLDRKSLGISSDALIESHFTEKLCSPECSVQCPNIIDLYFNLAAAEEVFLPNLCEAQQTNPRRAMAEIRSSGVVALAASGPSTLLSAAAPKASLEEASPPITNH